MNETILNRMFASRNRILVGLCQATVLIQSPITGGSMMSADLALGYNRDTYAVYPLNSKEKVWEGDRNLLATTVAEKIIDIDAWAEKLGKTLRIIRTRLFVLELLGWVFRAPGDRYVPI